MGAATDPTAARRKVTVVSTPLDAVDSLVSRVVAEAGTTTDPARLRAVFRLVLAELDVAPGDPAWTDGCDVIGAAYERVVAGRARRELGQFFTPLPIARAMANWLLIEEPELLLDPGCGSGSLLSAVAHERTGDTRLLGLDVDPLAVTMAEKNAALRQIAGFEARRSNFLLDPIDDRPDAIICNPPYTRHQALSSADKAAIHASFTQRLGIEFSQLASLHVLFLVRALEVAADGARLAFITPAYWLDMSYARHVKAFVLERAHVETIVHFPAHELIFEHAVTTASLTLLRKTGSPGGKTRLLRATSGTRDAILSKVEDADAGQHVALEVTQKWSRAPRRKNPAGARLEDVARVRRGLATGCNEFFVVSDAERRLYGLNRSMLRHCLTSPRAFSVDEVDERVMANLPDSTPRWLLAPSRERLGGPLERYLSRAHELGVRSRCLVRQREKAGRPWWKVEADFEAPILFSYFNRRRPRFVRNRVAGVPLNNWLVIQPAEDVDPDALFGVLVSRNVVGRLENDARQYGNGLWKLEPSELRRLSLGRSRESLLLGR